MRNAFVRSSLKLIVAPEDGIRAEESFQDGGKVRNPAKPLGRAARAAPGQEGRMLGQKLWGYS